MRKRERENPCAICGHYHKYEEGEVCATCGHRLPVSADNPITLSGGAFPSEILEGFLFLGSYDNSSRNEILKTMGISHILNTVPSCPNLYRNSFTYHCLEDDKSLQFDGAIQFLEQCERDKARVLVHCMTGRSRSPAIVVAYLMKCKGWRFSQSLQWVKERRPQVELSSATQQQLLDYEKRIFGSNETAAGQSLIPPDSFPTFGIEPPVSSQLPIFNQLGTMSIFERNDPNANATPNDFVFGAGKSQEPNDKENTSFGAPMDSS